MKVAAKAISIDMHDDIPVLIAEIRDNFPPHAFPIATKLTAIACF